MPISTGLARDWTTDVLWDVYIGSGRHKDPGGGLGRHKDPGAGRRAGPLKKNLAGRTGRHGGPAPHTISYTIFYILYIIDCIKS